MIEWSGSHYPGVILETRADGFLISYDGYASSYDEVVPASRLAPMQPIAGAVEHRLPARSDVRITVRPLDGKRINVYGYSFDVRSPDLPPLAAAVQRCEAILIALSGARGVEQGRFELVVELE